MGYLDAGQIVKVVRLTEEVVRVSLFGALNERQRVAADGLQNALAPAGQLLGAEIHLVH